MNSQPEVNLPHDDQIEREILGACFSENPGVFANVRAILSADEFFVDFHQRVYGGMCRLADAGEPIGIPNLHADLNARGKVSVSELAEFLGLSFGYGVEALLRRAKDLATRRRLIWHAREVAHHAADLSVPLADSTAAAALAIREASDSGASDCAGDVAGIIEQVGGITEFLKPRVGVPTPWSAVNYCLGGWRNGDLILIGARPSMGKTALTMNAIYWAAKKGVPSAFYSYEMTPEDLTRRLVSMLTGLPFLELLQGDLNASERRSVAEALESLSALPLRMFNFSGKTALALRVHAEKLKRNWGLGLAAVDYIGRMATAGKYDSRNHELGETCRQLKDVAADLQIPMIVLSQLNRLVESRKDNRPMMSDLRDSGDLEAHADVVALVHRPEYYDRESQEKRGLAEFIIGKQRNGDTPTIPLFFRGECGKFETMDRTEGQAA